MTLNGQNMVVLELDLLNVISMYLYYTFFDMTLFFWSRRLLINIQNVLSASQLLPTVRKRGGLGSKGKAKRKRH